MVYNNKTQEELKRLIFRSKADKFIKTFTFIMRSDPAGAQEYLLGEHDEGRSLLEWAAMQENGEELIKFLLSTGIDINNQDEKGRTALFMAVDRGHVDNVRLLILNGADMDLADFEGNTPLHVAAEPKDNSTKLMKLLCTAGADVTIRDKYGATALHTAAKYNLEAIHAIITLRQGAINLSAQNYEGDTPLHYAATSETGYNCTYLLMLGADGTIANKHRKTAAQVANEWDYHGKDWKAIIQFDSDIQHDHEAFYKKIMARQAKEKTWVWELNELQDITKEAQKALSILNQNNPRTKDANEQFELLKQLKSEIANKVKKTTAESSSSESTRLLSEQIAEMQKQFQSFMQYMLRELKQDNKVIITGQQVQNEALAKVWEKQGIQEHKIKVHSTAITDINAKLNLYESVIGKMEEKIVNSTLSLTEKAQINSEIKSLNQLVQNIAKKGDAQGSTIEIITTKLTRLLERKEFGTTAFLNLHKKVKDIETTLAKDQVTTTLAITEIAYDDVLLNHPGLLTEVVKMFGWSQTIDLSQRLNRDLIAEAIEDNDSGIILAGLISLENSYV